MTSSGWSASSSQFGEPAPAALGAVGVRLREGAEELAPVVRALDAEGIAVHNLEIHAPTLDDVFLAKTGKRLEGADADGADEPRTTGEMEAVGA